MTVDPWMLEHLVCPADHTPLRVDGDTLVSDAGRSYPVVEGVPVMLAEGDQTLWVAESSRRLAPNRATDPYYLDSVGVSDEERATIRRMIADGAGSIDPVVSCLVGATNGIAYRHLIGKLRDYPIPAIRLPPGNGQLLLDVGCNWGRWCIAAAQKGYRPVGLDPSLGAVMAARRVCARLGVKARFVVGDARFLPFRSDLFNEVFSYSVLQHFSRENAASAVHEMGRVLRPGGLALVQMPTVLGLRCLYHQLRRRFREPAGFEVRYYSLPALLAMFSEGIGPTRATVDCYFGIGLQRSDMKFMTSFLKAVVLASEGLRMASRVFRPLTYLADSVYLASTKQT
jgi:SAM-dependent methyltransferase/uncharacterized protein YbaR (Trm112 family)